MIEIVETRTSQTQTNEKTKQNTRLENKKQTQVDW